MCGDILIAKDPEALPPGGKRVEAASLVIQAYAQSEPYYDQFLDQFIVEKDQMLANAEELEVELGAVIFADGRLIGRDQDGWLSDLFSEWVAHKQTCYREILRNRSSFVGFFTAALDPLRDPKVTVSPPIDPAVTTNDKSTSLRNYPSCIAVRPV